MSNIDNLQTFPIKKRPHAKPLYSEPQLHVQYSPILQPSAGESPCLYSHNVLSHTSIPKGQFSNTVMAQSFLFIANITGSNNFQVKLAQFKTFLV